MYASWIVHMIAWNTKKQTAWSIDFVNWSFFYEAGSPRRILKDSLVKYSSSIVRTFNVLGEIYTLKIFRDEKCTCIKFIQVYLKAYKLFDAIFMLNQFVKKSQTDIYNQSDFILSNNAVSVYGNLD